jgi:hypothetical protein
MRKRRASEHHFLLLSSFSFFSFFFSPSGIPAADHDVDEHGVVLERGRRVSLTLRRLGPNQLLDVPADAPHDPNRPAY